ncbi:nitrate reductase [Denitromonas ohlonensis]|uniref:nitrate reductase (cytochrome) n=2 Tax=Denitromonas TaxID=139331 RepID=A0A557RBX6_9RHOO|nr:nitrate reductase [Denitromonas ohlonensis]TVO62665.1 molybdopterin-dependent oxidoreductase [Denitromonas ohlonensis]TVO78869.1 molybdopterin-dependent oxidoreductase [Denitromonas ohlonensis]
MSETKSTCCYCGVGCGLIVEHDAGQITGVRGDPDHPANFGRLCTKGATLHLTVAADTRSQRAHTPELRTDRSATRQPTDWATALDHVADRFAAIIREHGPDAVAFYGSGQWLTEDYYVFNKLAKGLIGTNNLDTNSRLCMSSAVAGYKLSLGADAPPCSYTDIDATDCLFIAGSNTAFAHPIVFRRIEAAREANPDMKLVVVDPRRTDTAEAADLHLPILPGTDIALFNAMLHVMLWEGWLNRDYIAEHTEGFDALKRLVREYTPAMAAAVCGVPKRDIEQAAEWFATRPATLSMYCQGLNQYASGTHKNAALINLHLATGQIGRPGAGPFSLTGQPNAMGGREVGALANLMSGHRDMSDPAHRAEVARLWGVPEVPSAPGKPAVELFEALKNGEIKAVWIAATNPAQSLPDQAMVHAALEAAELVVVQDTYRHTETAAYADVLLPASGWGEKDGTVTNSERRISRTHAAVPPIGEARHDWEIACDFAHRLGPRIGKGAQAYAQFGFDSVEAVWQEHRESTRGRDLDITGLSYAKLDADGPQQWPFPDGATAGRVRLYEDGVFPTPSGKARFVATDYVVTAESPSARYPLHLITGRLRDQWHSMTRTGLVPRLYNHEPEPQLHMHAEDLARRDLADGDIVRVRSRQGAVVLKVIASDTVRQGQSFLPMHWGGNTMAGTLGINALTPSVTDPTSKQPELKHAAIQVEKLAAGHALMAMRRITDTSAFDVLEALRAQMKDLPYASLTLAGREVPVVVLKARADEADTALLDAVDAAMGLDDPAHTLVYADAHRDVAKRARVDDDILNAVRLSGETRAAEWLTELMVRGEPAAPVRPWLLAPLTQPPAGQPARGKVVCNCFDVSEEAIVTAFHAGESLEQLQTRTRCGTNCGSCLPELKRLAARS